MKISSWYKLIGILCIVFGFYRIMSGFSELLISDMNEMPPALFKPKFLVYIEILVNAAYFMAGLFFLLKKSFSLNLMYFALTLKILSGIISLQFIELPEFAALNIAFKLVNPLFNAVMLIIVWRLAKYYFKSHEELAELSGKQEKRNSLTQKQLKIFSLAGILFLSVPLLLFILWIYSSTSGTTQMESVSIFNSFLPGFLQGRFNTTYLSIIFCIVGLIFSIVGLKYQEKLWTIMNIVVVSLCSLMLLLNLFSML